MKNLEASMMKRSWNRNKKQLAKLNKKMLITFIDADWLRSVKEDRKRCIELNKYYKERYNSYQRLYNKSFQFSE